MSNGYTLNVSARTCNIIQHVITPKNLKVTEEHSFAWHPFHREFGRHRLIVVIVIHERYNGKWFVWATRYTPFEFLILCTFWGGSRGAGETQRKPIDKIYPNRNGKYSCSQYAARDGKTFTRTNSEHTALLLFPLSKTFAAHAHTRSISLVLL